MVTIKSRSEVARLTGVTRYTLLRYEDIGLLKPTKKDNHQTCLYGNKAINKLMAIEVFRKVGYKRMEVKEILSITDLEQVALEYDKAIQKLKEKKQEIAGMISLMRILKMGLDMPDSVSVVLENMDVTEFFHKQNFCQKMQKDIKEGAKINEEDIDEMESFMKVMYILEVMAMLKDQDIHSQVIRDCYRWFAKSFLYLALEEDEEFEMTLKDLSQEEFETKFLEACIYLIDEYEIDDYLDENVGLESSDFVRNVLKIYKIKKPIIESEE